MPGKALAAGRIKRDSESTLGTLKLQAHGRFSGTQPSMWDAILERQARESTKTQVLIPAPLVITGPRPWPTVPSL